MEPRAGSWLQVLGTLSSEAFAACRGCFECPCAVLTPPEPLSCPCQQSDDECVLDLDLITDLVLQIDAHGEPGGSCLTLSSSSAGGMEREPLQSLCRDTTM